jgi:methylated-DNA-[protein]-cysteine S-methyltransferase
MRKGTLAMKLNLSQIDSPLGELLLVTDEEKKIRALGFGDQQAHLHRGLRQHYGQYELTEIFIPYDIDAALQSYFDGDFAVLDKIPTAMAGNELQRQVWAALRSIPAGQMMSYSAVAWSLGYDDPRTAIEFAAAISENPIAIVVPSHRVIGKNGGFRGYAWGQHRKRWLLEHEQVLLSVQKRRSGLAIFSSGF